MKKLSIIAALALVTTIGGVYATWNYAGTKVEQVSHSKNIVITDAVTTTTHGKVHVHADTLTLSIDDMGGYVPGWNKTITNANGGSLWIDFVPNTGAPDSVTFTYEITIVNNTYLDDGKNKVKIFDLETDTIVSSTTVNLDLTQTADQPHDCVGAFLIKEYSVQEIMALLPVNDDFKVDTLAEYKRFKEALEKVEIKTTVTDVTTNPAE